MRAAACTIVIALAVCLSSLAQDQSAPTPPPAGTSPADKQKNAASATQDTSGTTGDQITKPPAAKGTTLIGCLSGPDKDGKYTLRNMNHRTGVQVLGSEDLKNDAGSKVKLTGQWQPGTPPPGAKSESSPAEMPRFQSTDVEVMASTCRPPGETTPVSKNKRGKTTTYEAPAGDSSR